MAFTVTKPTRLHDNVGPTLDAAKNCAWIEDKADFHFSGNRVYQDLTLNL
jgi:hypothetical protein